MKSKIIIKSKGKLSSASAFIEDTQKEVDNLLNEGYEVKSSNITTDGNFLYIYFLLIKN